MYFLSYWYLHNMYDLNHAMGGVQASKRKIINKTIVLIGKLQKLIALKYYFECAKSEFLYHWKWNFFDLMKEVLPVKELWMLNQQGKLNKLLSVVNILWKENFSFSFCNSSASLRQSCTFSLFLEHKEVLII